MESTETTRYLSPQEVFERYGIALQTLANWRSKGQGPAWTKTAGRLGSPGGRVGYPEDKLAAYMDSRTVPAAA